MSTVTEIEEAISRLPEPERELLESRLVAHRFGLDALSDDVQNELLESLNQSRKEVAQGEVFTADQLRSEMGGWVGK